MRSILITGCMICMLAACDTGYEDYRDQLDAGLASGERYDSLFLTLHFGMSKKDFFTTCWKLNKEGYIMQGPKNLSVEYDLENGELDYPGHMRFYPVFHEGTIYRMPMEFSYQSAMPTDPERSADALITDVKRLMENWYGKGFIFLENDEGNKKVYVKIDGNRRIRIFKKDLTTVAVDITDMPVQLTLNEDDETE